jgi:type IV pilus assembly protein PilQ
MKYRYRKIILAFGFVWLSLFSGQAQITSVNTRQLIDSLQKTVPELSSTISLSVGDAGIQDFLRGVASSSGLNLSVSPSLNFRVSNSFTNVKVADLLVYLSEQYGLAIKATGNIFTISAQEVPPPPATTPKPNVIYDEASDKLTLDFTNAELSAATREIIRVTGRNLILLPGSEQVKVSGYVQQMPFESALQKFGLANNFNVKHTPDGFYVFESLGGGTADQPANRTQPRQRIVIPDSPVSISAVSTDSISLDVKNVSLPDIVASLLKKLSLDYYFLDPIEGTITMRLSHVSLERVLDDLFRGTDYTFKKQGNSYWFGSVKNPELRENRIVKMERRTVEKIKDYIPEPLSNGVIIKEFIDQNSVLLTGYRPRIDDLESFLNQLDKKVPVVSIEVMIMEVQDTKTLTTGLKAFLGDSTVKTSGTVFPGANMTLSSTSINNFISRFTSFSSINIGKVTPNFYVTLSALESNGLVDIQSTPKLSTLNGHEATLTIGSTEYYKETQSSYYGSLTTSLSTNYTYKSSNADLTVKITPYVSGNEDVTLDIEVKQTDFSGTKLDSNAPPNTTSRNFKSLIRVKNEDMVLLGGLEQKKNSNSGEGVPLLSRIPILKWFFSYRSKTNSKTKLNLFIRPTVIY